MMKMNYKRTSAILLLVFIMITRIAMAEVIPLAEHPRPDMERKEWQNLNGIWDFTFNENQANKAITEQNGFKDKEILVPFSWTCKLSGIKDTSYYKGWYHKEISIPNDWKGKRIFLVIGAAEYETELWLDGKYIGKHQGGYTPFEFEITSSVKHGGKHNLIISCDDSESRTQFGDESTMHLFGKQEYGNVSGIWQTVYLEARGSNYIRYAHFTPDIDNSKVKVDIELDGVPKSALVAEVNFPNLDCQKADIQFSEKHVTFDIPIENQRLWSIDDPYLYENCISIKTIHGKTIDEINSYFGQRKIGVDYLPGTDYRYVTLNNKPIYLQLTLDQSYHPDGFYTFPSDEFMKNEIMQSKRLGLNGNRIHIKTEIPRKLYWADKLGLLIMADIPCFWGAPIDIAKQDWERCLREQIERDYNHPSIFAWIDFNETWGLMQIYGKKETYTKQTQKWVVDMYHLTKSLDPSRLVEDNSTCNADHTETDINSWHTYIPSYNWKKTLDRYDRETYVGSKHNFAEGYTQGQQPMINSECGNVWGYRGSAGDSDFSWDYHGMTNAFRCHPKCAGFLYTEHHDVLNEWNGYVRYDRTPKYDGLSDLLPSMTLSDLHSLYYICADTSLNIICHGGDEIALPLRASYMTDKDPGKLTLRCQLVGWNQLGEYGLYGYQQYNIPFKPWGQLTLDPITLNIPKQQGVYVLQMILTNQHGEIKHRNFTTITVKDGDSITLPKTTIVSFNPHNFKSQKWSLLQKSVMEGLKENGFGHGYFEYEVTIPNNVNLKNVGSVTLLAELSAKKLLGKDITEDIRGLSEMEFIAGRGTKDPTAPPCACSMTDDYLYPSRVIVNVNGTDVGEYELDDDPADHRGILSWGSQKKDRTLKEAGSYGYLINIPIPTNIITSHNLVIRFTVPKDVNHGEGGLAIYGRDFGRYPLDPTLILKMK